MNKRYLVIFSGIHETVDLFKSRMSGLGVSSIIVEKIIRKAPVILKAGMAYEQAKKYADAVQKTGGIVEIQEHGFIKDQCKDESYLNIEPLENFTMCPQCGYKQHKKEVCVKCGFSLKEA
jgi:hypothetical protein